MTSQKSGMLFVLVDALPDYSLLKKSLTGGKFNLNARCKSFTGRVCHASSNAGRRATTSLRAPSGWARCLVSGTPRLLATRAALLSRPGLLDAPSVMSHELCTPLCSDLFSRPRLWLVCAALAGDEAVWDGARGPQRVDPALTELSRAWVRPICRSQAPCEHQAVQSLRVLLLRSPTCLSCRARRRRKSR